MRDDIHRQLPLSRAWKRCVKVCSREAEARNRPAFFAQAVGSELRQARPSFLDEARRAILATQGALFPTDLFRPAFEARTPFEASILRECAAVTKRGLSVDEPMHRALTSALEDRLPAVMREIRAQGSIKFSRDYPELLSRLVQAERDADLSSLVRRFLAGESPPRRQRLHLDLDSDLRSGQ